MSNSNLRHTELPIRIREILLPDGSQAWRSTVLCPRYGRAMQVVHCFPCSSYREFAFRAGGSGVVRCEEPERAGRRGEWKPPDQLDQVDAVAERTPVAALLSWRVQCVHPDVIIGSFDLGSLGLASGTPLPVVDETGRPLGILSQREIRGDASPREGLGCTSSSAREVMRPVELTLDDRTSVARALARLAAVGAQSAIVVDRDEAILGLVSVFDIVSWLRRRLPSQATAQK